MDIDWRLFDRRVADPTATAFRWVESSLTARPDDGTLEQGLTAMGPQARAHALSRLRMLALSPPADPAETGRIAALRARVEEALDAANAPSPVLDLHKAEQVNRLWDRLSQIAANAGATSARETIAALRTLDDDIAATKDQPPVACLHDDLHEMCAQVADYLGDAHARQHESDAAARCYARAASEVEAIGLPEAASRYRLKIARLHYARSTDYREALTALLRLKDDAGFKIGPLTGAILERMLAEAYAKIGDTYEAARSAHRARAALERQGFVAPDRDALPRCFETWVRQSDAGTEDAVDFTRRLFHVVETYTALAGLRSRIANDATKRDEAAADLDALTALFERMQSRKSAQDRRDRDYLAATGFGSLDALGDGPDALEQAFARQKALLARLADARRRESGGATDQALRDELAAAIDEAVSTGAHEIADHLRDVLADVYGHLEQWDAAIALWRTASEGALSRAELENYRYYMLKLMGPYMSRGDHAGLSQVCAQAIDVIEQHRYDLATLNQQAAFLQQSIRFYHMGIFAAWKLRDDSLMLERMELAKARASLRALAHRPAAADASAEADVLAEIRALEAGLRDGSLDADEATLQRRRTLYDLLSLVRADGHGTLPAREFDLPALQASLAEDEAILYYYWLHPTVLLTVGIDCGRVVTSRQVIEEPVAARLADLVGALHTMASLHVDLAAVRSFQSLLLPPALTPLLAGKRRLAFSPHQFLHLFPFHLLAWQGDFLFEHFATWHIPNLGARNVRFERRAPDATLAIGATRFEGAAADLDPLPGVAAEFDALRTLYRRQGRSLSVWMNDEASVARLREAGAGGALARYRVLHVATHGQDVLEQTANPMETRLYLWDGHVDALEIGSWQLQADLVVLSACHSGRRPYRSRVGDETLESDEMFGLTAALFQAGARAVLGALWPADDEVAAGLMATVHDRLAEAPPEVALAEAMRAHLAQRAPRFAAHGTRGVREARVVDGPADKRNPAFWAPFFITRLGPTQG